MDELVKVQLITLTNTINELTKTKKNKTEAQKTYQTLETTLPVLHEEEVKLNRRREEIVKTLAQVQSVWNQKYGSICRVFDFEPQKVDLSTKDTFESSIELLEQTIEDTNKILQANLKEKFKDFSEIIIKKEISEQEVDNIITILTQKIEKLLETKQRCEEIRDWINKYLEEILDVEQKLKALDLTNTLIVILKEIFTPIYDKTDLETIAERLAESIEVEVKEAYQRILADESLKFTHVGKAMFRNTLNDQPITHPSGSQRASISVGIMMSLAKAFNLPLILDEATDRYDSNHVKTFMEYVTAIVSDSTNPQISLAIYKTMDVENNPELLSVIQGATTYGIERKDPLNKIIKKLDLIN